MLQTDQQFPSVSSQTKGLKINSDDSVDVYFGMLLVAAWVSLPTIGSHGPNRGSSFSDQTLM